MDGEPVARNSAGKRCAAPWRPLSAAVLLVVIAAAGSGLASASVPYVCPVGTVTPNTELCGDGGVIALIRQGGDKVQLVHFLNKVILLAQQQTARELSRDPLRGRLAELSPDVRAFRSFPNAFLFHFKTGLATQNRLDRLAFELCDVLRRSPARGSAGCHETRITVRLEPSLKLHAHDGVPDDPLYPESDQPNQWALRDQAGIKAAAAWNRVGTIANLQPVKVATLDTGIASVDKELESTLMVDGADFTVTPPLVKDPGDGDGHGTKVASVIAARTNNNKAMAGITWSGQAEGRTATLMPIRIMGSTSPSRQEQCTNGLLDALPYAVDPYGEVDAGNTAADTFWDLLTVPDSAVGPFRPQKGAKIINLSAGYRDCSTDVGETLRRIEQFFPDALFVVAVPNSDGDALHLNMDGTPPMPDYPTSYPFSNILSVTATNDSRCVAEKYGKTSVDIAAPGVSIVVLDGVSTDPQTASGTSFAAPHVSGAAALLKSLAPDWQFAQVKQYLMDSSDRSMCTVTGANGGCSGVTNWPTICDGVASGLLDLDAATAPPVTQIAVLSNSDAANTWRTSKPASLTWQHTFSSAECQQVDADLIVDQDDAGTSTTTVRLSAAPLDVGARSALFDLTTMASVASTGIPATAESAQARVRLQCVASHMFRTSPAFTVRRSE